MLFLCCDKDYVHKITKFLETCDTKYDTIQNRAMVWDFLKCELRGITIEYSIKKAKRTRQYVNELNEELKKLESKLDNNEDVSDAYNTIRNEL